MDERRREAADEEGDEKERRDVRADEKQHPALRRLRHRRRPLAEGARLLE